MKDKLYTKVLNNNLYCCCREINIPNFQIALIVKSGSMKEKIGQSGVAHCIEHINLLWDKHENDKYFYGHGYTNYFETVYILNCEVSNYKKAIQIIENITGGVYLRQEFLDESMLDVIKEIKESSQRDAQIYKILFEDDLLLEKLPVGKVSNVKSLSLENIKKFFRDNYVKSNMAVCVVSSLPVDKYLNMIEQCIGKSCIEDNYVPHEYNHKSDNCFASFGKHNTDYEMLMYKYVDLKNWLPNEIRAGYDFFLDILRKRLYDELSLKFGIIGITCSLKKFYQGDRILKIRIVLKNSNPDILNIVPEILRSGSGSCCIESIKAQYKEYMNSKDFFFRPEDFIKECIDEVLGIEKIISIDEEKKLIERLLNLSEQEIKNYLEILFLNLNMVE